MEIDKTSKEYRLLNSLMGFNWYRGVPIELISIIELLKSKGLTLDEIEEIFQEIVTTVRNEYE